MHIRTSLRRRVAAGALLTAVASTSLIGLGSTPASAHYDYCELPWDPSQAYSYVACVALATVHNNVWHAVFP